MAETLVTVPFEDREIEVKVSGFGHWEDESASTLRGYRSRHVWVCDEIDFLPLGFTPEECQAIEKHLQEHDQEIKKELEENVGVR